MKKILVSMAVLVAFATAAQVFAQPAKPQTPPAKPQTTPAQPQTSPANVNIPVSKVAVIFSAAFQDPKQGIAKFTVLLNQLNSKYQKTQDDLNNTAKTINA